MREENGLKREEPVNSQSNMDSVRGILGMLSHKGRRGKEKMNNLKEIYTKKRRLLFVQTAEGKIDRSAERLFRHYPGYETAILSFGQVTSEEIDRADTIFVLKIGQKRALGRISSKAKTKTSVLCFSQSHKLGNVGATLDKSLAREGGEAEEFRISKRRRVGE